MGDLSHPGPQYAFICTNLSENYKEGKPEEENPAKVMDL
jgi:hypothetical protein